MPLSQLKTLLSISHKNSKFEVQFDLIRFFEYKSYPDLIWFLLDSTQFNSIFIWLNLIWLLFDFYIWFWYSTWVDWFLFMFFIRIGSINVKTILFLENKSRIESSQVKWGLYSTYVKSNQGMNRIWKIESNSNHVQIQLNSTVEKHYSSWKGLKRLTGDPLFVEL